MADSRRWKVALAASAALVLPGVVQAQEPERNVTVVQRARPDYDPLGIRAGAFFVFPSLGITGSYDDNVFATPNDEEDDFGVQILPAIDVRSNWSRHQLNLKASGDVAFFQDVSDNNYQDAKLDADGRIDITRDNIVSVALTVGREHESRESPDNVSNAVSLNEIYRGQGRISYRHNFNRVFAIVGGEAIHLDFENDDIDQDIRDRWVYRTDLRVGYQLSPRLNVFGQADYNWVRYDDDAADRDSEGFSLRVGSGIDISGLLFGELSVGYREQNYESDVLDDVSGIGALGRLTWNITPLTSLIFTVSADVLETTVAFDGEIASSDFQKQATVNVQHELRRNVILLGGLGYVRDDFEGTGRSDDSFVAEVGASYLINRNFSVDAEYNLTKRLSDDNDEEYLRNVIRVGLTARL